ncbi:MAG TPA: phage tail assembly chaperone [Phenylobacterium sp.]|nr:phage tail assembly chaperone [Phenylobacterium sp.]
MSPAWAGLLRAALALGVTPEAFWRLSLAEWRAVAGEAAPATTRAAFEALAALHPDEDHG